MLDNDVKTALKEIVKKNKIKDLKGVHELVKELTAGTIQTLLEVELNDELGYAKHDYQNKQTDNSRNGYSKKTLDSSLGSFEVRFMSAGIRIKTIKRLRLNRFQ